ncbi:MAG TPA: LacI family DNA-binding transcriptional regulator [Trebonia sp.]
MARRSGVSVSTASRALQGSGRVSPVTEARVRAAAAALAYRPACSPGGSGWRATGWRCAARAWSPTRP